MIFSRNRMHPRWWAGFWTLWAMLTPALAQEAVTQTLWEAEFGLGRLEGAVFSPEGQYAASFGNRGAVLWSVESGDLVRRLARVDPVSAAVFSPDGRLLLTGSRDGVARIWTPIIAGG